jgi:DNA-binding MurR/RpiR family transcriptional regulator
MLPAHIPTFEFEKIHDLAPAERRVVEYLLTSGAESLVLNAKQLGTLTGTSDATVVRAAKSLGYGRLADLRRALAEYTSEPSPEERVRAAIRADDVLEDDIEVAEQSLTRLRETVGRGKFDRAVDILHRSDRIIWRGVGPSGCLAEYAKLHSRRIGHRSSAITRMGTELADELLSLNASDAVVVLSYGPVQRHTQVVFDHGKQVGAPVILITDHDATNLGRQADLLLECGRGRERGFQSHGVTLILIESLILGVAKRAEDRWTRSTSLLNGLRKQIAGRQVDVDRK